MSIRLGGARGLRAGGCTGRCRRRGRRVALEPVLDATKHGDWVCWAAVAAGAGARSGARDTCRGTRTSAAREPSARHGHHAGPQSPGVTHSRATQAHRVRTALPGYQGSTRKTREADTAACTRQCVPQPPHSHGSSSNAAGTKRHPRASPGNAPANHELGLALLRLVGTPQHALALSRSQSRAKRQLDRRSARPHDKRTEKTLSGTQESN